MNTKPKNRLWSLEIGFVVGIVTSAIAICGELLRWFNCINAWLIGACAFTLLLSIFVRTYRGSAIAAAALITYLFVIPYTIVHEVVQNRWDVGDSVPMFFVTFFILVCGPIALSFLFGVLVDLIRQYLHSKVPAWF
jgi:hypothetical protein